MGKTVGDAVISTDTQGIELCSPSGYWSDNNGKISDTAKFEAEKKYYRNLAREVLGARTGYYARKMGVTYGRISIREQKTSGGSCSSVGNLNYNWKLVLMPPGVLDYVVVHELAHRREMNHSAAFWKVVATWMPDYKKYRKWLRDNGNQF